MEKWTADYVNDPNKDFDLIVEICCNGEEIGIIVFEENELVINIYEHKKDIKIPVGWFCKLLNDAVKQLKNKTE